MIQLREQKANGREVVATLTPALTTGKVSFQMATPIIPPNKRCSKCGQWFPATAKYFNRHSHTRDGFGSWCKDCKAIARGRIPPSQREQLPDGFKRCSVCHELKEATPIYFSRDRGRLASSCKACSSAKQRKEYADNPIKVLERNRAWRNENKEQIKERTKRYAAENSEHIREYQHDWYLKNKPRLQTNSQVYHETHRQENIQRVKIWGTLNPDKVRHIKRKYKHRRRSLVAQLPYQWTPSDEKFMFDYWSHRCCICGRPAGLWHTLALEHWIAVSDSRPDNPGTTPTNLLPMCHSKPGAPAGEPACNNNKGNKDPVEWLISKFGKRKARKKLTEIEAYFKAVTK